MRGGDTLSHQVELVPYRKMQTVTFVLLSITLYLLPGITGKPQHTVYGSPRQHRRQAVPEYKIDVLVLVDWKLFNHWVNLSSGSTNAERENNAKTNIRQYIALVFEGVNMRYANIADYRVIVSIVDIRIFEDRNGQHITPVNSFIGMLAANKTLHDLQTYVRNHQLPDNDHVMLFTGYDIVSTDSGVLFKYTTGQAFVGTLCERGRSISVVEDHAGFQSVHTVTHELAHSLNATHDGIQNPCRLQDRYIMAGGPSPTTEANKANPWIFSTCSKQELASFLTEKVKTSAGTTCLKQSLPVVGVMPDIRGLKAGQLYNPDQLCQHIYGQTSYYCRGQSFGNVSDICHSMFCLSDSSASTVSCNEHHAADFTSCGNKMWCSGGRCIHSEDAPPKDDKCVHGDEPSRQINGKTCVDLLTGADYFCYENITQTHCCQSCKTRFTGIDGCEYGDKVSGCDSSYCNIIYPNGTIQDTTCCGTCKFRPREWLCEDDTVTSGIDCSAVKGYHCYNWTVAFHCCETCFKLRHPQIKGCEYGDRTDNCPALTNNGRRCDAEIEPFCCKTCSTTSSADDSVPLSVWVILFLSIVCTVLTQSQTSM